MSISNFTSGFAAGVLMKGALFYDAIPGKVFWVDSVNGTTGGAGTYNSPLSTIDAAVGKCSANRGDVIFCKPGHVETVTAAGGLALDVAGISVVGLGRGSLRATVNFTTAVGADMNVDAANVTVQNILFTGGIDALTGPIDVNAADCILADCEWRDVTGQATDVIVADANANRLQILNYRHDGATAAGTNAGIALTGCDRVVIDGLYMDGNFAVGGIDIRTTAVTDLEVRNVMFRTRNAADIFLIDTITGSTGMIGPNLNLRLNDNAANITEAITGATWVLFDPIYVVNAAGEKAMLINTTASTDA
jgi:hypothetical protein